MLLRGKPGTAGYESFPLDVPAEAKNQRHSHDSNHYPNTVPIKWFTPFRHIELLPKHLPATSDSDTNLHISGGLLVRSRPDEIHGFVRPRAGITDGSRGFCYNPEKI